MDSTGKSTDLQAVAQEAINKRLDNLRFRVMTGDDFDTEAGEHSIQQVTFVVRNDGTDTTVELYKGDSKIGSLGGNGSGTRALLRDTRAREGEVVAINHCIISGNYGLS